ncbi:MAG: glycosyl transferase family 1 [Candidatus Brocadia sp. WS118]|nr:MAG: glycosyl transferase family 1 [Candidatus Brocadia sp. WS118]
MKICLIHNFYQLYGGEDHVYGVEKKLLTDHQHEVLEFTRHNDEIREFNGFQRAALVGITTYNSRVKQEFRKFVENNRPDILHFHNTFPLISPAVYSVGKELNIPVVQTIHNYRFFCANGLLYRKGKVCEDCFGKSFPWPAIAHACYRNSRLQSSTVAAMQAFHRLRKTWMKEIDTLIALTDFGKRKLLQAGFPGERIRIKPHFIHPDPGYEGVKGGYALFVGRLSVEKGVETLLSSWRNLSSIPLKIIGDGPLKVELRKYDRQEKLGSVEFLGRLPHPEVVPLMKKANFLVAPSECYETFGLIAIEAFACGTPVIASRLGAMQEIIDDGRTGLHFESGNVQDLAQKARWAWEHSSKMLEMGKEARKEYEDKYTAEKNYQMLMDIYHKAIDNKKRSI